MSTEINRRIFNAATRFYELNGRKASMLLMDGLAAQELTDFVNTLPGRHRDVSFAEVCSGAMTIGCLRVQIAEGPEPNWIDVR